MNLANAHPISFGSDNHAGVHPALLQALADANKFFAPSYEMDGASQDLQKLLRQKVECAESHLVFNGTAANVLALATAVKSYESILCADCSHLNSDECGAPEKFLGAKVIAIPHEQGKLNIEKVRQHLIRRGDQHFSQPRAISLTQPTEYGTAYTLEELAAFRALCDKENLVLHIDGARLGNACFQLKCEMKDILKFADVASVGGTKNGLLFGEIVVINKPELAKHAKFLRKQMTQLPSKTRFMAAQFIAYFSNNLWLEIAQHQCLMARELASRLKAIGRVTITQPVESNAVFCLLPRHIIKALREDFFFYVWDEATFECRLMTSYATRAEDIDAFANKLETLLRSS